MVPAALCSTRYLSADSEILKPSAFLTVQKELSFPDVQWSPIYCNTFCQKLQRLLQDKAEYLPLQLVNRCRTHNAIGIGMRGLDRRNTIFGLMTKPLRWGQNENLDADNYGGFR